MRDRGNKDITKEGRELGRGGSVRDRDITKEGRELGRGGSVRDRVRIRILQRKVEN